MPSLCLPGLLGKNLSEQKRAGCVSKTSSSRKAGMKSMSPKGINSGFVFKSFGFGFCLIFYNGLVL